MLKLNFGNDWVQRDPSARLNQDENTAVWCGPLTSPFGMSNFEMASNLLPFPRSLVLLGDWLVRLLTLSAYFLAQPAIQVPADELQLNIDKVGNPGNLISFNFLGSWKFRCAKEPWKYVKLKLCRNKAGSQDPANSRDRINPLILY